jgi:hypothetical protein
MSTERDTILSVTQMLLGSLIKSRRIESLTPEIIREQATVAATLSGVPDANIDALVDELVRRFDVFVQHAGILIDDDAHVRWARDVDRASWRFWPRCRTYLQTLLPAAVVDTIDEDTDRVLELIGDPRLTAPWDRRGLVVGEVQFGKTSNYAALACKAADSGYKIVIVLAGIHESLRMQTQIRMDEAFLGFRTDGSQALTGVGLLDPGVQAIAATARSQKGDFNKIVAEQFVVPLDSGPPIMLVVKKNAMMLRNLHAWLERIARSTDASGHRVISAVSALIIDDESDNASVDTGEQSFNSERQPDLTHRPTTINELIRKILATFERKSYVGYTATPFANIFIHHEGATAEADKDLFPKNFIVNLHAPSNYFGPLRAFGLEGDERSSTQLIRQIDASDSDAAQLRAWIPAKHKQALEPGPMPDTLRRAILSFVIVCAVRKLRGQVTEHNSMLVHVTRFTRLQSIVFDQIEEALLRFRRRLRFGDKTAEDSILTEMRSLWDSDFAPTSQLLREAKEPDIGELPDWPLVESMLADVATGIRVKQINGLAQDVLDYDSYRDEGIDVIVVGGDKLSRGLTLPGLSISYFTRQTDMYDTLLQMGRWFGYRNGYLDLCRLYTTRQLERAFTHIAVASDELRREFDYMVDIGAKPMDYGLKVKAHPVLAPTSSNKRRHAQNIVLYSSYAGGISEGKSFSLNPQVLEHNKRALDILVETIRRERGEPLALPIDRAYPGSHFWTDLPWATVRQFLDAYTAQKTSTRARPDLWVKYVDRQIAASGELKNWNVALVGDANGFPVNIGGLELRRRKRERDPDVDQGDGYRIKRLVTTRDAAIDFTPEQWQSALRLDPVHRLTGKSRTEPTARALSTIRQTAGINPLLMIYLPQASDIDGSIPVVGLAIAFPGSDRAIRDQVVYTVNTVYQAGHRADEDDEPLDDFEAAA